MIVFVHGKIGLSSPPPGAPYWKTLKADPDSFIKGAQTFFEDGSLWYTNHDFHWLSSSDDRKKQGRQYVRTHLGQWLKTNHSTDQVHFVAHSMGCAFAEGMAEALVREGIQIGGVVHINCFQAVSLEIRDDDRWWTVDYQFTDDPLINNPILKLLSMAQPALFKEPNP